VDVSRSDWTLAQRVKNDVLWLLASAALWACRPFEPNALRSIGRALGLAALWLAPRERELATRNLARIFPEMPEAERRVLRKRCYATLGECLGEAVSVLGRQTRGVAPLDIEPSSLTVFREALAQGRGVMFPSAHLGPWERVAPSLSAAGLPMAILARESYDARFTRLYERLRARGVREIVWRGRPGAAARILRALRRNYVLGVPMDLRSRVATCTAPFLGHDALTAIGPARIALRMRTPVVVGSVAPCARREWVVTASAIDTADLPPSPAGAVELTRRINSELSRRILAIPHAWVWMHSRWGPG
jgi:KDO2-lipid IV(A) lauroyltransferase